MFPRHLARGAMILLLLAIFPGCHVLVRLGKPPEQERAPSLDADAPPHEEMTPSSGPDTGPPRPGLDDDENQPPPPGLESRERSVETSEELLVPRAPSKIERVTLGSRPNQLSQSQLWRIRSRLTGNTGINTNTAIAPGEGQTVYRTQLRFLESHSTPTPADRDINVLVNPHVLAYGVREDLSIFGVIPLVKRDGTVRPPTPVGAVTELDDFGVADMRFFGKYRLSENDQPGETTRWSVFGGLEVPSFDKHFSSDSWDPFIGTVWTYQSLEWGLDFDWFWNFNTGNGVFRYDEMRYDAAYTYVLLTGQTLDDKVWQLNSVLELNGSYFTDGSNLLFAAPGFQLALESMIVEASLQLPVVRDLKTGVEPDYVFVIGSRITW